MNSKQQVPAKSGLKAPAGVAYQWAPGCVHATKANAQKVGEALDRLVDTMEGPVRPEDIISAATAPRSPLHPLFEWDDTVAAHQYRKEQARNITNHLVVVEQLGRGKSTSRAYVSVLEAGKERGYVSVSKAGGYDVATRARNELVGWCARYAGVKELNTLVAAVHGCLHTGNSKRSKTKVS